MHLIFCLKVAFCQFIAEKNDRLKFCDNIETLVDKSLFSRGWALWAKWDMTQTKKNVSLWWPNHPCWKVPTVKNLWKTYLSSCKKSFYKMFFPALKISCHRLYKFTSFSFWKFCWLTLIANWKKRSKPCCHCKSTTSVWTLVKGTDFILWPWECL